MSAHHAAAPNSCDHDCTRDSTNRHELDAQQAHVVDLLGLERHGLAGRYTPREWSIVNALIEWRNREKESA